MIIAIVMLAIFDLRALIVVGFLYYAYKILHKKEQLNRLDKILIICLFLLLVIAILLMYFSVTDYINIAETPESVV